MHEVNIAERIAQQIGRSMKRVKICVGELCDFLPTELKETLEKLIEGEVEVIEEESSVECECGYRGRAEILERSHGFVLYRCPKCGKKPRVIRGDKVEILEVE